MAQTLQAKQSSRRGRFVSKSSGIEGATRIAFSGHAMVACRAIFFGLSLLALFLTGALTCRGTDLPVVTHFRWDGTELRATTPLCVLVVRPLAPGAMRVRCAKGGTPEEKSIVLVQTKPFLGAQFKANGRNIIVSTTRMKAVLNLDTGSLQFTDPAGKAFLSEIPGSRKLEPATVHGEPTFLAEQEFASPADEHLFGSGQFQDGYLDVRDLPRRLTQVNSQIAIPFVLSSKGYGLLWHNYGLTDLNPANQQVELTPAGTGASSTADVTTTGGTRLQMFHEAHFVGEFDVPTGSRYACMLDVGQSMARRYHVEIDGQVVVDFANFWLPPTTSWLMDLPSGHHTVRVVGVDGDKPVLLLRPSEDKTVFRSPVAQAIDYVVFAGPKADDAIATYRQLTGPAPLMPEWAYGYIHCRERFKSSQEILDTAEEFRKRDLPLDVLVQDWQYWGKYGWNAMKWDENFYPDPAGMIRALHDMHIELMVSVWSKIDPKSEVGQEFVAKNYYIPGTQWVDFFNPAAASLYWENLSTRMLSLGIDAWWLDATEPENDDLAGRSTFVGPGDKVRLVYPLYVNKTVYEGQRRDAPQKRVFILSRSAFSGQQRYASTTWSGDIGNNWDTFRREIPAGLDYMASGLPYWTTDGGGFFRPGPGQYTDPAYQERFIRWFQFETFSPVQRVHGYQTDTEEWRYGPDVEEQTRRYLDLRYRLFPYIYSQAAAISFEGSTLMRPLVMDFPQDEMALTQKYEYMFGPALLVAPVLEGGAKQWDVYAPKTQGGWYDFWTGSHVPGGTSVTLDAPIDKIPLLVKAGSILPLGPVEQYTGEKPGAEIELRVYPGADADFTLYGDDGTNYDYEKGERSTIHLHWNDRKQELTIGPRQGRYPGMPMSQDFRIVVAGGTSSANGIEESTAGRVLHYNGAQIVASFPH